VNCGPCFPFPSKQNSQFLRYMFVYVRQEEDSYERNSVELKKKIGVQLRKKLKQKGRLGDH
jgi:hypothetical protein